MRSVLAISDSWGGPSDGTEASLDSQLFTHTAAVNTFVASGDIGNTRTTPDCPSTSLQGDRRRRRRHGAASPFVAGVYARYGISAATHDASYAYGHTTEFFDITSGRNGSCTSALCRAAAGWDGPTGVGSPNGATLGGGGGTTPPPTCAHSDCTTGGALTSGCNSCVTSICSQDSFCCNTSWDSICVGGVSSICGQTCP